MRYQWFVVGVVACVILFMSYISVLAPFFTKPPGRSYNFLRGYSNDYVGYVSYVKEGMYGRWWTIERTFLMSDQKATPMHFLYIVIGKVGSLLRMSAPAAYHVSQLLFGLIYLLCIYAFLVALLRNTLKSFMTFLVCIFSWTLSWYEPTANGFTYVSLSSFYNVGGGLIARFSSRPHYEFGGSIFVLLLLYLIGNKRLSWWLLLMAGFGGCILGLVQSPYAIIFFIMIGLAFIRKYFLTTWLHEDTKRYAPVVIGLIISIGLIYLNLKQYPWNLVYISTPFPTWPVIWQNILAFGPILWIGYPGLILSLIFRHGNKDKYWLIFFWITIQLAFFFILHRLIRTEPVRFIQSLYYIPLTLGVVWGIEAIPSVWSRRILYPVLALLIFTGIPRYVYEILHERMINTNYREYSAFIFPSDYMMDAYHFLDENTPAESRVLSAFEASQNILIYSHNYVYGASQGYSGEEFDKLSMENKLLFFGGMDVPAMQKYLKDREIQYVFVGYQERYSDVFEKHPELFEEVFHNHDVIIYKVKLYVHTPGVKEL